MRKSILFILFLILLNGFIPAQQTPWRLANGTEGIRMSDIDIYFSNPDSLYAMGQGINGVFLLSTDRGENWDSIAGTPIHGVFKIDPFDSRKIYLNHDILPFYGNEVLMSIDRGLNWTSLFWGIGHPPYVDAPIIEIDPVDLTTVYVSLNYHNIMRSNDHGNTWDSIPSPNGNALSSFKIAPSNNNIIYAGYAVPTQVFKSKDRGQTWTQMSFPLSEQSRLLLAVHPRDPDIVYATVFSYGFLPGGVYGTTDGGLTWVEKNNGLTNEDWDINDIIINPKLPEELYLGTGIKPLFKSIDSGESWFEFKEGLPGTSSVSSITIDTLNNRIYIGLAAWNRPGIYIYDGITSVEHKCLELSKTFLLYQNYPNPFNSTSVISYYLPKRSLVELTVFNVQGKLIKKLVNTYKSAGNHNVDYAAEKLPSGIYYYHLRVGSSYLVRKAILVK